MVHPKSIGKRKNRHHHTPHTSSFGDKVFSFFDNTFSTVKHAFGTVYNDITRGIGGVQDDLKLILNNSKDVVFHTEDKSSDIINNAVNKTEALGSNVASSLAMPLAIAAVAAGGIYYLSNKK